MSNLIRWEPSHQLSSMREAMDRLFEASLNRPLFEHFIAGAPAMNVYQTDDNVMVEVTLPGVQPDDANISISGGVLTIRGETSTEKEVNEAAYHMRERRDYTFNRSVVLPCEVDSEKVTAEFENGVLIITLPKIEEAKPKTIKAKLKK